MKKKLWEADHDYYCSSPAEGRRSIFKYDSFEEFLNLWGSVDMDHNLLFRWDWQNIESSDYDILLLHYVLQRKGMLLRVEVKVVKEEEPAIYEFLEPYHAKLKSIWQPFK